MSKVFFGTLDGKEIGSLDTISEIELTSESTDDRRLTEVLTEEMTFSCQIDDMEQFEKQVVCGGDRGRYNGYVLQRDGYLSPKNGWM